MRLSCEVSWRLHISDMFFLYPASDIRKMHKRMNIWKEKTIYSARDIRKMHQRMSKMQYQCKPIHKIDIEKSPVLKGSAAEAVAYKYDETYSIVKLSLRKNMLAFWGNP